MCDYTPFHIYRQAHNFHGPLWASAQKPVVYDASECLSDQLPITNITGKDIYFLKIKLYLLTINTK